MTLSRRVAGIWLLSILLLAMVMTAYAAEYAIADTIRLRDESSAQTKDYTTVNLTLGNSDILSDVPAFLYTVDLKGKRETRTLVPLRVISESLGANVAWRGEDKSIIIDYEELNIQLTIDRGTALINGQEIEMPSGVPPKLMTYEDTTRTFVPLRFVSEMLGTTVSWDGATRTVRIDRAKQYIKSIDYSNELMRQKIEIHTSGQVDMSTYYLSAVRTGENSQLVIDVPNVDFALLEEGQTVDNKSYFLEIDDKGIESLKGIALNDDKNTVRFIVQMTEPRGYEVNSDARGITLSFVNNIYKLAKKRNLEGVGLEIMGVEKPDYKLSHWKDKYIIDIFGARMNVAKDAAQNIDMTDAGILAVSFSQLDARPIYGDDRLVARVVLTLAEDVDFERVDVEQTGNNLFVYVDDSNRQYIDYQRVDQSTSRLVLSDWPKDCEYDYDEVENVVEITVPHGFGNFDKMDFRPNDAIVRAINHVEGDKTDKLYVELESGVVYSLEKDIAATRLIFENPHVKSGTSGRKVIVIDAGHGGKDPGAIIKEEELYEKTIVFNSALQLREKLKNYGYRVYMTRDHDVYVDLYGRTELANQIGADAFISIHANAAESLSAEGVETLYVEDERGSKAFANAVQKGMVKATNAKNRGIVNRPELVVIRETEMPAVLVEIGFMTNLEEREKLLDDRYINSLTSGIADGVVNYFK